MVPITMSKTIGNTKRNSAQNKIPITAITTPAFLKFSQFFNLAHSLARQGILVNSAFYQFLLWGFGGFVTN
jgi:hypothetical protein